MSTTTEPSPVSSWARSTGSMEPMVTGSLACHPGSRLTRLAFDPLARLESEGLGTWAPPPARRLSSAFAGLDVVAGCVLGRAAVDLLPDVLKVIALAQRRDNRH